jgi:hypothetical protein
VLWPLHEDLSRAREHLGRGDATWRHAAGRPEGLHDVASCLGAAARANLDDLLARDGAPLRPAIVRHAAAITALSTAAREAQATYEALVRQAAGHDRHARHVDDAGIAALAADLVNATVESTAGPEAALLDDLRRELPAVRAARPTALDAAFREALAATDALLEAIDALRGTLCDTYDLPPAPPTLHVHANHR